MRRATAVVGVLCLAGCAEFQVRENLLKACEFYVSVKAVVDLAALHYPMLLPTMLKITNAVDPVCKPVLAGGAAPTEHDATWVIARTVELEEIERSIKP